jgi:hypothetical protein
MLLPLFLKERKKVEEWAAHRRLLETTWLGLGNPQDLRNCHLIADPQVLSL